MNKVHVWPPAFLYIWLKVNWIVWIVVLLSCLFFWVNRSTTSSGVKQGFIFLWALPQHIWKRSGSQGDLSARLKRSKQGKTSWGSRGPVWSLSVSLYSVVPLLCSASHWRQQNRKFNTCWCQRAHQGDDRRTSWTSWEQKRRNCSPFCFLPIHLFSLSVRQPSAQGVREIRCMSVVFRFVCVFKVGRTWTCLRRTRGLRFSWNNPTAAFKVFMQSGESDTSPRGL